MHVSSGVEAARGLVKLVMEGERPSLEKLGRALDQLALSYYDTPEGALSDKDAHAQYSERHAKVESRFPDLGPYASISPKEELGEPNYGDAIDDLADIVGDLEEVLWRFRELGSDDANWFFRWAFETHWGRHLRDLSLYLHVKKFGGW